MALYWVIALYFDTHLHLVTSLFVAPLLLLRSERSIEAGVDWFRRDWLDAENYEKWSRTRKIVWLGMMAVLGFSVSWWIYSDLAYSQHEHQTGLLLFLYAALAGTIGVTVGMTAGNIVTSVVADADADVVANVVLGKIVVEDKDVAAGTAMRGGVAAGIAAGVAVVANIATVEGTIVAVVVVVVGTSVSVFIGMFMGAIGAAIVMGEFPIVDWVEDVVMDIAVIIANVLGVVEVVVRSTVGNDTVEVVSKIISVVVLMAGAVSMLVGVIYVAFVLMASFLTIIWTIGGPIVGTILIFIAASAIAIKAVIIRLLATLRFLFFLTESDLYPGIGWRITLSSTPKLPRNLYQTLGNTTNDILWTL